MNKEETRKAIEAVLPRGWTLDHLDMKNRSFQVTCPISDRFEVPDATFIGNVERIAMAADGEYDGGGSMVGGDRYDCFFFLNRRNGGRRRPLRPAAPRKRMTAEEESALRSKVHAWYRNLSEGDRHEIAIDCSVGERGCRLEARGCLEKLGLTKTRENVRVAGEELEDLTEAEFQY